MPEDWLEVYENCAYRLSNNLRLSETFILPFFPILFQDKQKLIRNSFKETYGLQTNKYFELFYLTFWGRSLVMISFRLYSNSRGANEIKGLPISIEFCNRNMELLLLFGIISPCFKVACTVQICYKSFFENSEKIVYNFIKMALFLWIYHLFIKTPLF